MLNMADPQKIRAEYSTSLLVLISRQSGSTKGVHPPGLRPSWGVCSTDLKSLRTDWRSVAPAAAGITELAVPLLRHELPIVARRMKR